MGAAGTPRRSLESLAANRVIAIVATTEEAIDLANLYAPEHLCLLLQNPWDAVPLVKHAGGIFVGEGSPEALGDYTAGPSHVMPTGGTARFFSPIHVGDFTKVISLAAANDRALNRLGPATIALAKAEGLGGHARAIEFRLRADRPRLVLVDDAERGDDALFARHARNRFDAHGRGHRFCRGVPERPQRGNDIVIGRDSAKGGASRVPGSFPLGRQSVWRPSWRQCQSSREELGIP
ncbi:MAG: histidinol dehydrogenase [Thermomicrobiales bacterium]